MAWEWSHTPEAYTNAYDNLCKKSKKFLRECAVEWAEHEGVKPPPADVPKENLAEHVWTKAEEQRTCDNGGFNAWACPGGCHTVSFDETNNQGKPLKKARHDYQ